MPNGDDYTPDFMTPGQIAANRAYAHALMQTGLPGGAITGSSGNVTAVSPLSPLVQGLSAGYGRTLMNQAGGEEQRRQNEPIASMLREPIPGDPRNQQAGNYPITPTGPTATSYTNENGQTKGSWFGNFKGKNNWVDDSDRGLQASGAPTSVPGIALPDRSTLGQLFDVTTPDGRTFTVRQTDLGPAKWTGRGVDVNSALAEQMGYTPKSFPTDGKFTVKPHTAATEQTQSALGQSQLPMHPSMQFAGPGAEGAPDTENDPQAAMAMALQRGMQPAGPGAPPMGVPGRVPAGGEGGQIVPSGFFPQRQQVSRETMGKMMTGDVDPGLRQYMGNSYFGQYQPIQMQGPFGWTIMQDAQHHQIAIPPAPHWGEVKAGDVTVPRAQFPTLGGGMVTMGGGGGPVTQAPQGAGSNIPKGGPQTPAGPGLNIGGGAGDIAAGRGANAPPNPNAAPGPRSEAAPTGKPVQVASRETGTATDAGPALAYAAPTAAPALATPPPAPAVRTAQAGGSLTDMSDKELADYSQERSLAKEFGSKDIEAYSKKFESYQDAGNKAITGLPQIQMARNMLEDPRMIQGPWADFRQGINNALTALTGNDRTTAATTLRDAFDKIRSSGILNQMRETLAGLGQVRLAEIQLLGQATASAGNTLGANRAIITLAERSAQQMSDISQITGLYRQGYRWDNDGKLITQNANDRPTTAGQEQAIRTYLLNHPLLSAEETKQYKEFLSLPEDKKGKAKAAAAGPTAADIQAEIARRAKAAQ